MMCVSPLGTPNTTGWHAGHAVWFDVCGLPCTAADLGAGLATLLLRLGELQQALTTADTRIAPADRPAWETLAARLAAQVQHQRALHALLLAAEADHAHTH